MLRAVVALQQEFKEKFKAISASSCVDLFQRLVRYPNMPWL